MGVSIATFFETYGPAIATATASAGTSYAVSSLLAPKTPNINIPPPPGAAMIDSAGQTAAADARRRAAAAGGLQSTITGAGQQAVGVSTATGGGKSLLGL
jgi:hypothetical protein